MFSSSALYMLNAQMSSKLEQKNLEHVRCLYRCCANKGGGRMDSWALCRVSI